MIRVWFPIFVWRDGRKTHYETHGVFDDMVTNKQKRTNVEQDFVSCYLVPSLDEPGNEFDKRKAGALYWVSMEIDTDRLVIRDGKLHATAPLEI